MPELPEVEVVRRGLLPHVQGREIREVQVHEPRSARRQEGGAPALVAELEGARVDALVRRGKFLWWRLSDGRTGRPRDRALITHLGMSGQLRVRGAIDATSPAVDPAPPCDLAPSRAPDEGPASDPLRHRRISLLLADGAAVDLVDQRLFGGLWTSPLVPAPDGLPAGMGGEDALLPTDAAHIARDVLDPHADLPAVARRIRTRRASVKSLLLAQDLISGIGNIYADEALWAARAHHETPGSSLSQVRAHRILTECRAVMERALAVGGTSFDALYVNVDGRSGYFARSLAVYGRQGQPCPRCGAPIVRERFMNRSSHLCPRCQRKR